MARPHAPLLSRDKIVAEALALIDAEGLASLSTRRLAGRLWVSGPSLYNHFATMDDLVEAVADAVIGEVDLDGLADAALDWPGAMRHWARSYRDVLAAHPNLVPVAVHGPGRRPAALKLADAVYGATVRAGWPAREATEIGALMRFFVAGAALGSFAGGFSEDPELYGENYPHLRRAHLLAARSRDIDDAAFELGLDSLLTGLADRLDSGRDSARDVHRDSARDSAG